MEEMAAVSVAEPEFFDLKQPWLTPRLRWTRLAGGDILEDLGGSGRRTPNFALTVDIDLPKHRYGQRWAADYSHGGSQGLNSPHVYPTCDDQRQRWGIVVSRVGWAGRIAMETS